MLSPTRDRPTRAFLLRRLRAVNVDGGLDIVLDPRADYGRRSVGTWHRRNGCWEVRGSGMVVRWWGGEQAEAHSVDRHHRLEMRLGLEAGSHFDLVLELISSKGRKDAAVVGEPPDPDALWDSTEEAWRLAIPTCEGMVGARDVRSSYALLRGMTGPEGGTVAAATTSLPERAEGNRNYDYRYVWVRDSCYVGRAGSVVPGGEAMLDDAVRWVGARVLADGDQLSPVYLPDGRPVPDVDTLGLPGYPGGTDVVGNRVRSQFQLDAFGEALLLFACAASRGRLDPTGWEAAQAALGAIDRRWTEPESGIWELEPNAWTHSRLICVAGIRAICRAGASPSWTTDYLALADTILARTASESLHTSGRWQRTPDDPRVDASLLLAQLRGALPPGDPRSQATRRAVIDELSEDGYVYRYGHQGHSLAQAEGAFLICNFWLALACFDAGETVEGVRWFERARSSAGPPGLLTEEFDVDQHQLRGNVPQAFVHALLIESAAAQAER